MSLSDYRVDAAVAVSDIERARDFYEGKLGLSAAGEDPDGGRTYACGAGTHLHVFPSPNARASGATVAGWQVDDIERVVDELTAKTVVFERYDGQPLTTDERGIAAPGDGKAAWFKDPEGNLFALVQR
jgi:catechol 2,3-dioxygenase-like lactoylglutathione lyase family enzyme